VSAEELVDVVDTSDRVVGRATRAEMRRDRLRHRATYILVFDPRGCLLVHRRTATKDVYPAYFDVAVGGVVGAGEEYGAAAERELAEEIGVSGVALEAIGDLRYEDENNRVHGAVFTCSWDGPLRLQPEEVESAEWLTLEALAARRRSGDQFCPDGLLALDTYLRRREQPADGAASDGKSAP